ncbi:MAG: DUF4091 domain-containing protein [Pseudoflavonifractor sp.]|nr:DUF4091 domain-containing protein [Alloprevotella sp.]MCM1116849.1 DUF4091 domain-containing protein [Pseudoflavonifractor sp.]
MKLLLSAIASMVIASSTMAQDAFHWTDASVHIPPSGPHKAVLRSDTTFTAWRGQRAGLQALIEPGLSLTGKTLYPRIKGAEGLDASARFMRYALTNDFRSCGVPPELEPWPVADIIDLDTAITMEHGRNYPLWVTVEVSERAPVRRQQMTLELVNEPTGKVEVSLPLTFEVQGMTLPSPQSEGYFHLNMWQQPYAVARYYGVEPWSESHLKLLEPYARYLARAGQKAITTIMFYEPWGEQSNDKFLPMVETLKKSDGSWAYDYSNFDRYVEFMDKMGVGPIIECFSMIPWEMNFRYRDEAKGGEYAWLKTKSDSPEYEDLWGNFLSAFKAHLDEKGWTDRTVMAMDERGLADIQRAIAIVDKYAPGVKVSLAGVYHPELVDKLYTYSIEASPWPAEVLKMRHEKGLPTTFYTCCATSAPNIFSNSDPADAAYIPAYCIAAGTDGYLHWSYQNWTDNPLDDTRFKLFAPGDTYFIYPDGRSSIRYERLVEGIQMGEKIKALRKCILGKGRIDLLDRLDEALIPIRMGLRGRQLPTSKIVADLQSDLTEISAALASN